MDILTQECLSKYTKETNLRGNIKTISLDVPPWKYLSYTKILSYRLRVFDQNNKCMIVYSALCGFCKQYVFTKEYHIDPTDECYRADEKMFSKITVNDRSNFQRNFFGYHGGKAYLYMGFDNGFAECENQMKSFVLMELIRDKSENTLTIHLRGLDKFVHAIDCWLDTEVRSCIFMTRIVYKPTSNNLQNKRYWPRPDCLTVRNENRVFSEDQYFKYSYPINFSNKQRYNLHCRHLSEEGWSLVWSNITERDLFRMQQYPQSNRSTEVFVMAIAVIFIGVMVVLFINGAVFYVYKSSRTRSPNESLFKSNWIDINSKIFN